MGSLTENETFKKEINGKYTNSIVRNTYSTF